MPTYKEIYIHLFAQTEDAIVALERGDVTHAMEILIEAQQEAEESVLSLEET